MKGKPYSCPMIRMPEIYLSIAEAMNQLGKANVPDEFEKTAYDYLNLVHERAGLPGVTSAKVPQGDALLNYLLDERAREFGQEDVRYFDMMRHKRVRNGLHVPWKCWKRRRSEVTSSMQ